MEHRRWRVRARGLRLRGERWCGFSRRIQRRRYGPVQRESHNDGCLSRSAERIHPRRISSEVKELDGATNGTTYGGGSVTREGWHRDDISSVTSAYRTTYVWDPLAGPDRSAVAQRQ